MISIYAEYSQAGHDRLWRIQCGINKAAVFSPQWTSYFQSSFKYECPKNGFITGTTITVNRGPLNVSTSTRLSTSTTLKFQTHPASPARSFPVAFQQIRIAYAESRKVGQVLIRTTRTSFKKWYHKLMETYIWLFLLVSLGIEETN